MSAETDLLPCPFCGTAPQCWGDSRWTYIRCGNDQCIVYSAEPLPYNGDTHWNDAITAWNTRANLAELQREVEGLRAEVAGLTAQVEHHTAYTVIHRGALRYCNSTMRDAYSDEHHRAERLAEALEELARGEEGDSIIRKIARAALDQETTNG